MKKCNNVINEGIFCDNHKNMNKYYNINENCKICNEIVDKTKEIPLLCGHIFYKTCLEKYDKLTCPSWRQIISADYINYIKNDTVIIVINEEINTNISDTNINHDINTISNTNYDTLTGDNCEDLERFDDAYCFCCLVYILKWLNRHPKIGLCVLVFAMIILIIIGVSFKVWMYQL